MVPFTWHRSVFNSLHGLFQEMLKLITAWFVCPGINADFSCSITPYIQCQYAKIQRHTNIPPSYFQFSGAHFNVIHSDLVGLLPPAQGFRYLFTSLDHLTRWPRSFPLMHITAQAIVQASSVAGILTLAFLLLLSPTMVISLNLNCGIC